ncbi:MAG: hypothetical protein QE274_09485 [Verrucomicrobiaceae bacterium]|nr:hypothetical protein [Verrucomicrobiaceae bacterium]
MSQIHFYQKAFSVGLALGLLASSAFAGGWNSMPQPLIIGPPGSNRDIATADAGSSLVMDSGWRCLYSILGNRVHLNYWTGKHFNQVSLASKFFDKHSNLTDESSLVRSQVKPGTALAVDQSWHMLYYISQDHGLVTAFRTGTQWKVVTLSPSVTHLLGVDQSWHIVYAYDEVQRSLLAFRWDTVLNRWASETIATNIGLPGAEGAVDSAWHVLYSSHADAPDLDHRGIPDQSTTYGIFKQWPLVATYWDGTQWRSQLIDKTSLPQRPAVRKSDHRVFYARRQDVNQSRWFQPNTKPFTTTKNAKGKAVANLTNLLPQDPTKGLGYKELGQERDTYVDDQNHVINWNPNYAKGWKRTSDSWTSGSSTWTWIGRPNYTIPSLYDSSNLTAVDCFIPEWTAETVPRHIKSYHSTMDQRRGDLVHQVAMSEISLAYRATAWVHAPNIYQRADGKFVKLTTSLAESSAQVWSLIGGTWTSESKQGSIYLYGQQFTSLQEAAGNRFATLDANASGPAPFLGSSASTVKTMGHSMNPKVTKTLLGRRCQNYTETQQEQSDTGGIATDPASTFVFYTQAPTPSLSYSDTWFNWYLPPSTGTDSAPTPAKTPAPKGQVWIVVIF